MGKSISIESVTLPGNDEAVTWEMTDKGLSVEFPGTELNEMAVVLKIETSG